MVLKFFPTRLLDLDSSGRTTDLHLMVSENSQPDGPYMTLSHCWGKAEVLKLTSKNIEKLKRGITLEEMSG